jgi:small subunit ribosomal protein S2
MSMQSFTMRQLLESGVHYGHHTRRWNPKMSPYIFGIRGGVHILDLQQTVPLLHRAMEAIRNTVAGGGRVLFVGTKSQASEKIMESAKKCGQYFINHRWLGGTLTNWKTVNQSIKRMKEMEERLNGAVGLTKKEHLELERSYTKLERTLGGIREMGGLPDILFVVDTNKEDIAIQEARRLNIPVVAILDSNSNPDEITYPIPGNDDAIRAITLYCDLISSAVLDGLQAEMTSAGIDVGSSANLPFEDFGDSSTNTEKMDHPFDSDNPSQIEPKLAAEIPVSTERADNLQE